MAPKLDRNGIPVLDPPGQNHLKTARCHPALHEWVRDRAKPDDFDSDYDWVYGITTTVTTIPLVCARCGATDEDKVVRSREDYPGALKKAGR